MEVQIIGGDIGRGFVKAYTEYNGMKSGCLFKSIVALGRFMDTSEYKDPIYIEHTNVEYFVGELGEKEGDNPVHNLRDDKTSETVNILIAAILNKLAISDKVKLVLGVPNKLFNKKTMNEVKEAYKGKRYTIKDKLTGAYKKITLEEVTIFREGDASLLWYTKDRESMNKPFGMVTVGFRTTEFSYYDEGFRFNDKHSKTKELGNKTALEFVQRKLAEKGVMRELSEIDSSDKYDDLKAVAYNILRESIENEIENTWINTSEMDIRIAGGTPLNLKKISYEIIDDPQMATAKGLFLIGEEVF